MAEVVLSDVEKVYEGGARAVRSFSLVVPDGEFLVLVGPSGCGKSSMLNIIAGLERPTAGTVKIGGRVVNDVPAKDRDIAMVFQSYALYPHMTVEKNMAFGLELRKVPKAEIAKRIQEAAAVLGLTKYLDRLPQALSGGERQRVAVGRAIVRQPTVFLFDEPLSNLDAKLRAQMRVEIKELHARLGTTMIYVTHDQVEAMTMGQRVVVMEAGAIQQVADPVTLYDAPVNRFVAGFVGTPPMNFVEGAVEAREGRLFFVEDGGVTVEIPRGAHVDAYAGRAITLGVRPEGLSLDAAAEGAIGGTLRLIETVGGEAYLHVDAGKSTLIARVDAHHGRTRGDRVALAPRPGALHFFDPSTGAAIR